MKHLIFSLLAIVMLSVACENGDNNNLPHKPDTKSCYTGLLVVDQNDGTVFEQSGVEVDYELKSGLLNFVMYKVKFAKAMPIKLDMVVEGADYTEALDGTLTLSGDDLVPYAMGGPFEKYTITELTGEITDKTMSLSFMCGEYPVTYTGER